METLKPARLLKSTLTGLLVYLSGAFLVLSGFVRTAWGYTAILALCAVFFQCRIPYMTSIYGHRTLLYAGYAHSRCQGIYRPGVGGGLNLLPILQRQVCFHFLAEPAPPSGTVTIYLD